MPAGGVPLLTRARSPESLHVRGLQALRALVDLELDLVVLLQVAIPVALDGTEVHEDVRSALLGDKPETFLRVEPLDGSCRHKQSLLSWPDRSSSLRDRRPPDHAGRGLLVYPMLRPQGRKSSTPAGDAARPVCEFPAAISRCHSLQLLSAGARVAAPGATDRGGVIRMA